MNFCKKCGGKLENGVCSSCTTSSNNIESDTTTNTSTFDHKEKVEKNPMSPKIKKIIIASCVGISLCAVAFVGFKAYQGNRQEKYAKEAISLVTDGKFEDANDILNKYKKDDTSVLDLKDLNTLYLEVKKECESNNFDRISELELAISINSQGSHYIDKLAELRILGEKLKALDSLNSVDDLLSQGNINLAKNYVEKCKNYNLTAEEKATVDKVTARIDETSNKLQKEEEKNKLKNTYLSRYNTLAAHYHSNYFREKYEYLSEADMVTNNMKFADDWDILLNDVWKILEKNMDSSEFSKLKKEQIQWVDEKMKLENSKNEMHRSGNAFAQDKYWSLGNMNRERVKYLIDNYL